MSNVTDQDVSTFLTQLIELGGVDTVDDSPDKYIRDMDGNIVTINWEGKAYNLAIYGTKATDVAIINPFAEGEANSARHIWFYSSRNTILSGVLIKIMIHLLQIGANAHKKGKNKEQQPVDLDAAEFLSKHVLKVDEPMVKEFDKLQKASLRDFAKVYYNTSTKTGEFNCIIFNTAQRSSVAKSVRTSTWTTLENIMLDVLRVKSLSEFSYKSHMLGCPMFDAVAHVLVNVYAHLQDALKMMGTPVLTVTSLESHLKYIQEYFDRSKWCHSAIASMPVQAAPAMPGQYPWSPTYSAFGMPQQTYPWHQGGYVPPQQLPAPVQPYMPMMPMQPMQPMQPYPMGMQPTFNQISPEAAYAAQTGNPFIQVK